MPLLNELESFFSRQPDPIQGDRLVIAFSGGPDSTALAWGLQRLASKLDLDLRAVHIDHGLDGDSRRRAAAARDLCSYLGIPLTTVQSSIPPRLGPAESLEAAARKIRYRILEDQRRQLGASFILTAHHADDQIETLAIRLLYGTGLEGLAGIQERQGRVLRPLLGLRQAEIKQVLGENDLVPVADPSNLHWGPVRNRVRQLLLPELLGEEPQVDEQLLALAITASSVRTQVEGLLRPVLDLRHTERGLEFRKRSLQHLPRNLWPFALALVHREAGVPYPPSAAATQELARQIGRADRIGCDCGAGWRWQGRGPWIGLFKHPTPTPSFAYTVEAPGECEIEELSLRFRIRRGAVDSWMFRQSSRRVGLELPLLAGDSVVVRNRRPGDRVRPLGCQYTRRLKDLMIDRRVPRYERSRLPLLEVESRVVWVPGVTIDDAHRIGVGREVWIAELESL